MSYSVTILMTQFVTHDVRRFVVSRPPGFVFEPGQGVEVVIDEPKWKDEDGRPFTPTCLREDGVLEFTIKAYPDHHGVTEKLHTLEPGAKLLITDPFGTITYQGPGVFIAGGAGITPFLSIMRNLAKGGALGGHSLLFSNKTPADVICERELRHVFGDRCVLTCTRQSAPGYESRRIDRAFLVEKIKDFSQRFYVCGPDIFVEEIKATLQDLGAQPESLVFEQ